MIRPTRWAALLFALSVPLALVVATAFPGAWYVSLYYPFLILVAMAVDATRTLPRGALRATVEAPKRLYIGRTAALRVVVDAGGWKRPTPLRAVVEIDGDAEQPEEAAGTLENGRAVLAMSATPSRRGRLRLVALWLRWRGPLGLVERRLRRDESLVVEVVPDVRGVHEEALRFFAEDSAIGMKSQRRRGEGAEFDTLCEYARGMDSRHIDWKHSARHRKLLCKEFRQERNHQVVLGFDTGHLMLERLDGSPRLDHAIRAGLVLGWASLYGGDLVGGCGFDVRFRGFMQPGRGMPYFNQIQRFAAGLEYHTEETNFTLGLMELDARLKRRGLVVLFSEFVDAISAELLLESLRRMTRKHVVIFVAMRDPMLARLSEQAPRSFLGAAEAVLADDFLRDRSVVLERMARMGVHCLDVPVGALSTALLNRYLFIKQRGLL